MAEEKIGKVVQVIGPVVDIKFDSDSLPNIYNEIKRSGGYAIFPHPFWKIKEQYHTETKMSDAIFKNRLCDAFEIMGGCSAEENNLQLDMYYNLRLKGIKMPIVASSDSHSSLPGSSW